MQETFAPAVTAGSHISTTDYDALRESLRGSGTLVALPELHGGLCGALCAGGPTAAERWLDDFVADSDAADPTQADFALAELKEYVRVSVQIVFEQLADRREATARDAH